jgi:hypothetical protein
MDMRDTQENGSYHFGWRKTLVYSLLPLLALTGLLEGAARLAELKWPPVPVDIGMGFTAGSRLFVPCPFLDGWMMTDPNKAIFQGNYVDTHETISDLPTMPFRRSLFARKKPPQTLRLFFLGESSINYIDWQLSELAKRLKERFPEFAKVEVIDCGGCAYGSHRIVPIMAEVLQYEPDIVLLYAGHNEFEEQEQMRFVNPHLAPLQHVLWKSAFVRFLRDRLAAARVQGMYAERNRQILGKKVEPWDFDARTLSKEQIDVRMLAFRRNLESMAQMAREHNVPFIMGSIPSNLMKPNLISPDKERYESEVLPKFAAGDYENGKKIAQDILRHASRHQASDIENEILREVARAYNAPFAEVEKRVTEAEPHHVPGETLFNDHCHLNETGNDLLAATYEDKIVDLLRRMGHTEHASSGKSGE